MNTQNFGTTNEADAEGINIGQVIEFFSEQWKRLAIGAVVGLVLGVAGWFLVANYKAETVLINNGAINFMSWRGLQKNLPILASQMVDSKQVRPEDEEQFRRLSAAAWWVKNVVPTYSLSKADTKDLAAIGKDLQESGGSNILNLVITSTGSSKHGAEQNVEITSKFIKQGSAYLTIKNLVNGYESQVLNIDAELQKKITDTEVELKFMRERAKNLEALRQRFPANAAVGNQQIVDLKDTNSKFMPISTQLVAVNSDINNAVESLQRMRDELARMKVLREFVAQASPIIAKQTNGLALADDLLKIESEIRAAAADDINAIQALNTIESALVSVKTNFNKGLDSDLLPQVTKSGPVLPAVGGLFGGLVVMLCLVLGQAAVARFKGNA